MNEKTIALSLVLSQILAKDKFTANDSQKIAVGLVNVQQKAYLKEYADITYPQIVPVIDLQDPTSEAFEYYEVEEAGKGQFSNEDGKVHYVDAKIKKTFKKLHDANIGYKYTDKELARASKMNVLLSTEKPQICIRTSLRHAQDVCFNGDSSRGIEGFFNHTGITELTPIGGGAWSSKTPKEIVADINHLFTTGWEITKQVEFKIGSDTNRLLLPTAKYSYIANTPMSDANDTTILSFLLKNSQFLSNKEQVLPSPDIATDTIRAYQFDEDKLAFYWGDKIKFKAPQSDDLAIKVPATYSIGGTVVREIQSIIEMKGV